MTDLLQVLPDFDAGSYAHLLPSLEKAFVTTSDLLTLDAPLVGKRAQLPPGELRKLADALLSALHKQLGFGGIDNNASSQQSRWASHSASKHEWKCISTLDEKLDEALGGGIPRGYVVEITGESGAGKTQFLLTLLLAAQLPSPHGLSRSAVYISTEAALATNRLAQMLSCNPVLASLPEDQRPSLSRILSIQTPDLESQEHILRYQLPVAIEKHGVGLVILDSVAANYRAEFEKMSPGNGAASMARRGTQLVQLGALLRELARDYGIVVVVANQVADRFTKPPPSISSVPTSRTTSTSSQPVSRTTSIESQGNAPHPLSQPPHQISQTQPTILTSHDPLALDHQQQWFTGWGDMQHEPAQTQKTPSLGLVWTNQLACRIALIKLPVFASRPLVHNVCAEGHWKDAEEVHILKWRRWFKLVFAPWVAPSDGRGVEFEIQKSGIRHVEQTMK